MAVNELCRKVPLIEQKQGLEGMQGILPFTAPTFRTAGWIQAGQVPYQVHDLLAG
ncbi:hypothetical protein [Sphingobacterium sp.]|uniref:hypothetical protein n=1 Tax=Sphingobacterium sp. TaxID=341027 RepID=UPI0028990E1D|nr:hypothetical protein [Sphingobacterium sp.]